MNYQSRGMRNLERAANIRKVSTGLLAAGWFGGIYYLCDSLGASPGESLAVTSLLGFPTYVLAYITKETILDKILGPRERLYEINRSEPSGYSAHSSGGSSGGGSTPDISKIPDKETFSKTNNQIFGCRSEALIYYTTMKSLYEKRGNQEKADNMKTRIIMTESLPYGSFPDEK